jgi:hypothetical protein
VCVRKEGGEAAVTERTGVSVGGKAMMHRRGDLNAVLLFLTEAVIERERNV